MASEDYDIYNDLPADCGAKYEEENKTLKQKIKFLVKKLQASEREKHNLNEKNAQLQRNISSLFKTACTEVNRKKRTIDDLRTQLENSVFRRSKKCKVDSPIPRNGEFSESDKKQCNSSDHFAKFVEKGYEAESLDRLKSVCNVPVKASAEVEQEAAIPSSHVTSTAVCPTLKQSCSLKRQVQHTKAPITLYSQRLLERAMASQKKDSLSPEKKPDRLCNISDVDSNQAMSPSHVNLSKIAEMEYVSSTAEVKCPPAVAKCESTAEVKHEAVLSTQAKVPESAEVKHVFTAEVKREPAPEVKLFTAVVKRDCTTLVKSKSIAEVECEAVLPSQLNTPESTEVKCEAVLNSCVNMPGSAEVEYESTAEVKPESTLVERKFTYDPGDSSKTIQKTEKSLKNTVKKFDLDCMELDKIEDFSVSQVRTVQKFESQIKSEHNSMIVDQESMTIPDFRRRRRAKVISVSAGNKIIFDTPVSSSVGRNDKNGVSHVVMSDILRSSRTENTSSQSSNDISLQTRPTLPLKKVNSSENKFFESFKTSDALCKNVICQNSDGDSGDNCGYKFKLDVQESTRTVEDLRGRCAGMSIDQFDGPNTLKSVSQKTVYKKNDNGNTLKGNLTIQERLKAIAENYMWSAAPAYKEATVANTKSQSLEESKVVTLCRRRRKPVSLGDSSFVVSGTS